MRAHFCRGLILGLLLLLGGCEDYPKDPNRTLEEARRSGVMHIGLITNPPWVEAAPGQPPQGVEVALIEAFAQKHGFRPQWHVLPLREAQDALASYQLALFAGGLTRQTVQSLKIEASRVYYTERFIIATPPQHAAPPAGESMPVAVPQGSWLKPLLKSHGVTPQESAAPFTTGLPVAAAAWQAEAKGYEAAEELAVFEHVIAVQSGENALLVALERELANASVAELLKGEAP